MNHKSLKYILDQKELNMRQRQWLELLKYYNCELLYHPSRANLVADSLSQNEYSGSIKATNSRIDMVSSLFKKIKVSQTESLKEENLKSEIMVKQHLQLTEDGCVKLFKIRVWWEHITMDFVTKLPKTLSDHDTIWVVVDRLTKSAHFLTMRKTLPMDKLEKLYIDEVISRHGVLFAWQKKRVLFLSLIFGLMKVKSCVEEPDAILEEKSKKLFHKEIMMVKVQWNHHRGANVTWEAEEDMKRRYPHLLE
ncbi:hypothetical protein L6452_15028 [Arctium lappa]|uniref:Uncharacterized protein n=1 Tax=Arctium lappa TaxID=4217 RepID=A0ACB9CMN0_ARCLA|nr:hypothetical protein L6452_15028 [Arctium lappa]